MAWDLHEHGPADASQTALLLPGGMCTAAFYDGLAREPALQEARLVAATLPGFGGTPPGADATMEGWVREAGALASEVGADVVVGHSVGANVVLEMAASGLISCPLVLLAPSFSSPDEEKAFRALDRVGRVPGVGPLAWWAAMKMMGRMAKDMLPEDSAAKLVPEMQRNDPGVSRRLCRSYFDYLDRHGSVVSRLCDTGARAWVVFGDHKEVGLQDAERTALEACSTVTLQTIPDATHMMFLEHPARIAELVAEALAVSPRVGSA